MAVNNLFRVIYDFKDGNKKQAWDGQQTDLVVAATGTESAIKTVLTNNNRMRPGANVDIISVTVVSSNVLT